MNVITVPLQFRVFPKFRTANETINNHFTDFMYLPLVIPLFFQSSEVIVTEPTPEAGYFSRVSAFHVFIEHRWKMKLLIAIEARYRRIVVVVLHVLCYHLLRVEFSLAEIALEVFGAVDLLVFREVTGIAEGLIAKCAFV